MTAKTALLFKGSTEESSDSYSELIESLGVKCFVIPVLSFNFINIDELADRLKQPSKYSGIVFSSPRVVQAVGKCLPADDAWADHLAFAVGKKTAEDVQKLGLKPLGSEAGIGSVLSEVILEHTIKKPLLLPCGNLSTNTIYDALTQGGVEIDRLTVYETIPNPDLEPIVKEVLQRTSNLVHFILYFSPSGVKATFPILEACGLQLKSIKFGAIGPTTEAALSKLTAVSFVAEKPTPEHFAESLKKCLETQPLDEVS